MFYRRGTMNDQQAFSSNSAVTEMQIKTTVRYHLLCVSLTKVKSPKQQNIGKSMRQMEYFIGH